MTCTAERFDLAELDFPTPPSRRGVATCFVTEKPYEDCEHCAEIMGTRMVLQTERRLDVKMVRTEEAWTPPRLPCVCSPRRADLLWRKKVREMAGGGGGR